MKNFTKSVLVLMLLTSINLISFGQDDKKDEKKDEKVNIKRGWTFGALPAVTYNSDLGLQYGALANIFNYGDGSTYPKYRHMFKVEVSRFTKGSGVNQIFYDSDKLFKKKNIRLTADLSYLTDKAVDFYGFNGAMSKLNLDYSTNDANDYISRMFYRMERNIVRFTCDFQGQIIPGKLRWLGGLAFFNVKIGTVDINRLNKGKDSVDMLPDTELLFDKYVNWGIIAPIDADGGHFQYLKTGLIFDTRDFEANPSKGLWTELLFLAAPSFLGNNENPHAKLVFIHRQYFTLIPKNLSFAYRLGYQATLFGNSPFYFNTYMFSSYAAVTMVEGLGGMKSVRGILRDRVLGEDIVYGNFEFRWKFLRTTLGKQNLYLALNPFMDAGSVVGNIPLDKSQVSASDLSKYFNADKDKLHLTAGCGFRIALNENFIISVDYGRALDKQDGNKGLYIATGWLF